MKSNRIESGSHKSPPSLLAEVIRTAVSLYVIMLVILAAIFLQSLERKRVNQVEEDVTYTWQQMKVIIESEERFEDALEQCLKFELDVEYKRCRASSLAFVRFSHYDDVVACVEHWKDSGGYSEYFRVSPAPTQSGGATHSPQGRPPRNEEPGTLCDIREPGAGTWGQVWDEVKSALRVIVDAVWGAPSTLATLPTPAFKVYEHCVEGSSGDCTDAYDVYEAIGELDRNDEQWRIRVLKVETNGWFQDLGGDGEQYAVFLIVLVTATGMIAAMLFLIGRKARDFGRQANRMRDQLNNREVMVIDDGGYGRELAGIATAAGARVAEAREIRERLMRCAVELGYAISHNENKALSTLNLPDPIPTSAKEGQNVSRERLEVVNNVIVGARESLDGISKQLIRCSIGDFSGTSDLVDVGETLAEVIGVVKAASVRDLVWHENIPDLSAGPIFVS